MNKWTDYGACAAIGGFDEEEHSDDDIIDAYQHLIDTGTVWHLQGFYRRAANQLLEEGLCYERD